MQTKPQHAETGNPFANFMSREDFARQAKITKRTAELWAHERKGPRVTIIGGRAYYHVDDIEAWLNGLRKRDAKREPKRRAA